jgi:hypothetical protein
LISTGYRPNSQRGMSSKPDGFDAGVVRSGGGDCVAGLGETQEAGLAGIGLGAAIAASGVGFVTAIGRGCGMTRAAVDVVRGLGSGSTVPTSDASRLAVDVCESAVAVVIAGFPSQPH